MLHRGVDFRCADTWWNSQVPFWRIFGRPESGTKKSKEPRRFWIELLQYTVLQRFATMGLKEVGDMLQLTSLKETAGGRELIAIGRQKGLQEGLQKGELIGEIRACQRVLKMVVTPRQTMRKMSLRELRALLSKLDDKL